MGWLWNRVGVGMGEWRMGNGRREGHNCDERTKKPQREIET